MGRVNGGLNLSRALGDQDYKANGLLRPEQQQISPIPEIKKKVIDKNGFASQLINWSIA